MHSVRTRKSGLRAVLDSNILARFLLTPRGFSGRLPWAHRQWVSPPEITTVVDIAFGNAQLSIAKPVTRIAMGSVKIIRVGALGTARNLLVR